jgi:hypothetical protein
MLLDFAAVKCVIIRVHPRNLIFSTFGKISSCILFSTACSQNSGGQSLFGRGITVLPVLTYAVI